MNAAPQLSLLDWKPLGTTANEFDTARLGRQMRAVYEYMSDGNWHTLPEISRATGHREASVSARFRDLKNQFGFITEHKNCGGGLWMYRLILDRSHTRAEAA
jgi:hypothetical protein